MQGMATTFAGGTMNRTPSLQSYWPPMLEQLRYSNSQFPFIGGANAPGPLHAPLRAPHQGPLNLGPMSPAPSQHNYNTGPSILPTNELSGIDFNTTSYSLNGYPPLPPNFPLDSNSYDTSYGHPPAALYEQYTQGTSTMPPPMSALPAPQMGLHTQGTPSVTPPSSVSMPQMGGYTQGTHTTSLSSGHPYTATYGQYIQGPYNIPPSTTFASPAPQIGIPSISPPLTSVPMSQIGPSLQGTCTASPSPVTSSSQSGVGGFTAGTAFTTPTATPGLTEQGPFSLGATKDFPYPPTAPQSNSTSISNVNIDLEALFSPSKSFGDWTSSLLEGALATRDTFTSALDMSGDYLDSAYVDSMLDGLDANFFSMDPISDPESTSPRLGGDLGATLSDLTHVTQQEGSMSAGDYSSASSSNVQPQEKAATLQPLGADWTQTPDPALLQSKNPPPSESSNTSTPSYSWHVEGCAQVTDSGLAAGKKPEEQHIEVRGFVHATPASKGLTRDQMKRRRISDEESEVDRAAKRRRTKRSPSMDAAKQLSHATAPGDGEATTNQQQARRLSTNTHVPDNQTKISAEGDLACASIQEARGPKVRRRRAQEKALIEGGIGRPAPDLRDLVEGEPLTLTKLQDKVRGRQICRHSHNGRDYCGMDYYEGADNRYMAHHREAHYAKHHKCCSYKPDGPATRVCAQPGCGETIYSRALDQHLERNKHLLADMRFVRFACPEKDECPFGPIDFIPGTEWFDRKMKLHKKSKCAWKGEPNSWKVVDEEPNMEAYKVDVQGEKASA